MTQYKKQINKNTVRIVSYSHTNIFNLLIVIDLRETRSMKLIFLLLVQVQLTEDKKLIEISKMTLNKFCFRRSLELMVYP